MIHRLSQWLSGRPWRAFPGALVLVAGLWAALTGIARADVVIVDSNKHPDSFRLAENIGRSCTGCGHIQYMDMARSPETGRAIVKELRTREREGTLAHVITLGPLATRVIAREIGRTPVFYLTHTMAGSELPQGDRAAGIVLTPAVGLELAAFKALAPSMQRVGLLARRATIDPVREELIAAATELGLGLSFFYVDRPEDVSPGLRQAIGETDGLFFLRDLAVVNSDTIRFILRLTLENRIPTFAYSPELVSMGMGAAIHVDDEKLAAQIGTMVSARIRGEAEGAPAPPPFVVEINRNALAASGGITPGSVLGMEVVSR